MRCSFNGSAKPVMICSTYRFGYAISEISSTFTCSPSRLKPEYRWCSRLQLALELVEKAPIRAVGDDLLRAGVNHADLAQPQRVESHRVLGVVLPPLVVGDLAQRLFGIVIAIGDTAGDKLPRNSRGVADAKIGGLQ